MVTASFRAGEEVEVHCVDAWYEARVIHSFVGHPSRYFVAYDNGAVTETVSAARVRPRPDPGSAALFRLHQLVDVFFNEGWRVGVVSKARATAEEEWRYDVCLPDKREEMEFGSVDMRVHLDWVDGKWVSAEEKGTTETMYSMGTQVEVAHVNKILPVVWYTAIVIKVVGENIFLVEYESLRTEDDTLLREIVASQYVRPCPPRASEVRNFELLDEVEAFYSNGWWPGVVAKVHSGSRYNVKFMHWEEEIEFSHEELRLLYDWIDGQWVQASQDKSIKSQNLGKTMSVAYMQLLHASSGAHKPKAPVLITPLSGCEDEALCKFPIHATNSENKNSERLTFQSQPQSSQPCKKSKKGETIEDNTRLLDFLVIARGTKTSSAVKTGFDVTTPIIEEEPNFRIKALVEKCCSTSPFKKMNVVSPDTVTKTSSNILLGETNDETPIPEKLSQESIMLHTPLSMIRLLDKGEELSRPGAERSGNCEFLRTVEWEQNKGVWCPMTLCQQRKELVPKHQLQGGKVPYNSRTRHFTEGERRRKKGRPQKLRIIEPSLEGDSMGNQHDNEVVAEPPIEGLSTSQPEAITQCGTCTNGLEAQELLNVMVGSSDASLVETSVSGIQSSEAGSEAQNEVLLSTEGGQLAKRALIERAGDAFDGKSPTEKSPLPFEKCSSLWDSIESMEEFSAMPQRPHFRPLEQYCKEFREGMAIGLMVTFSNLVNSIGNLRITDSRHMFDERLKTLVHLEGHGFDVERIRACLVELLRMKDNQERLVDERSALELLIVEKQKEKDRLNAGIESVEKAVMELEQSLSHFHEKKSYISKQKRENDSEVAKLQMDSRTVEDALLFAERDSVETLSAAW